VGQSYEITVPFAPGYREDFDRVHRRRYGYADTKRPAEIVNLRVKARGLTDKPRLPRVSQAGSAAAKPYAVRPACFGGRERPTAFFHREDLRAGSKARGPAVLAGAEATVVIPPGFGFEVDGFGNVIATRTESSRSSGWRRA
jgi:N-methylhydantoinase A